VVLRNGKIFTADPDNPAAEALAICGERLAAVGSNDALRGVVDTHTTIIDLAGRTVVPGFNDAHMHASLLPFPFFVGDLDPTLDDAVAQIEARVASQPAGTGIGGLIGPTVLDDPLATRALLDSIAPNHPVYLTAYTGHGLLFNTALMELASIDETALDPEGGFFTRDGDTGALAGIAHEYAGAPFDRRIGAMQPDAVNAAVYTFLDLVFAAQGITSVQLMNTAQRTVDAQRVIAQANPKLRWRIIRFPVPEDPEWPLDAVDPAAPSHPLVRVDGVKWILDGTPIERLAALRAPYADMPETSGRMNFSPARIASMLESALAAGEQPMFHAVGDRAIETLLSAMEAVADDGTWTPVRVRIEHGDLLMPDLVERARRLGVIIVQNPIHFTDPFIAGRFDPERSAHGASLRTVLDAGIPLALGSDGPTSPFDDIRFAVENPVNPAGAITREEAVIAHTRGAAFAELAENEKGTLCPGLLADIAVLSQDIFSVPLEQVSNTRSLLTIVGGEIVWRDAEL
jgi:predicted amidohydrolase YtcJ